MAFKINERQSVDSWVEAEEELWLTADREKLVAAGDPEAAFLFTTPGKRISRDDAIRYGLVKAKAAKAAPPASEPPPDEKPDRKTGTARRRKSGTRKTATRKKSGTRKRAASRKSSRKKT